MYGIAEKKRMIASVLVLLILAACQLPGKMPSESKALTEAQVHALALRILDNTLEHIHWAKGTVFSWVLLEPGENPMPAGLYEEVIRLLKEKYTVYTKKLDIPNDRISRRGDVVIGYRGGFSFHIDVKSEKQETVRVQYDDWEGQLAGSWHWTRYKWHRGNWEIIEKSDLIVS